MKRVLDNAKGSGHAAHTSEAANAGPSLHPILQLQQQAGNYAVQDLLRRHMIQAKLTVSRPDDAEEQEADQVAAQVMRKAAGFPIGSACSCSDSDEPCESCSRAGAAIHRRVDGHGSHGARPTSVSGPASAGKAVSSVFRGESGRPLDASTRAFFEPRFGRDFSHVRIHDGPNAAASARSIDAHAYTAGNHVAFASGQFSPESTSGRELLAHELVHTIQQEDGPAAVNRHAIMRSPANAPAATIDSKTALEGLAWDTAGGLIAWGISGPLPPGTVRTDGNLRLEQKDAEHVEIKNGEAWVTITTDPGVKYSYYIEPAAERPPAREPDIPIFDADAPPAPPVQRVVRVVGTSPSEVRIDSFNPEAQVQQLVVHDRYGGDTNLKSEMGDVREFPYGKSSMDISVQESAIRILTPEDSPVAPPPSTFPDGAKFAYTIEPDWTGPSSTEKRVFIAASPGVIVVPLESAYAPAYSYGRRIIPVIIRVPHPDKVPEQGENISLENFVSQEAFGDIDSSKPLEEQSGVLTASAGMSGVTITEPYSGARITIRPSQPGLGAAFAWQVVPAQGGSPGEIRIVAGPGTYVEFAEPVPERLRDHNGNATPTPRRKDNARIGEGFSTELSIVQLSDASQVPVQGTSLNLSYYQQFGQLRDPDVHQWLGTNDVPFMIANMFFHAIPIVGTALSILDCVSALAKDEDFFGEEQDKNGKIMTCAMAVVAVGIEGIGAIAGKLGAEAAAAERALQMAQRISTAQKLGRSVEEVEVALGRAAPLARDPVEGARLARAARAMDAGEEILEDDLPAVERALAESAEFTSSGTRLPSFKLGWKGISLNPAEMPLESRPGFAKDLVDKFQATGEVPEELETAVRQKGESWEQGRAEMQQSIKDAARDPAAGIDPEAAATLAEDIPSADPKADAAEATPAHAPKSAAHEPTPAREPAKAPKSTESAKAYESAEPTKPDPQTTAKPGDFTREQLADANKRLEDRIADPKNVRAAAPETGYDLEVDLGDGQIYRRRPDGTWCLFRNPKLCGINPGSEVAGVAERQVARLETEAAIDDAVNNMVQAGQLDRTEAAIAAMKEHLRENPEDLIRLMKMQGHPGAMDIALEHRIDRVIASQPAMDANTDLAVREYLRTHPDRLEQLEALHSDTATTQFGTEDLPERGDAKYGGSGPVEAGKEGKDLSRAVARKLNPGVARPWIADELSFEFQMPDGTTRVTIPDVGMRASDGSGFLIDSKFGPNAEERLLQQLGYPEIAAGRAIPTGPAATRFAHEIYPNWQPGTPMPATPVEIYNWRRATLGTGEFGSDWNVNVDRARYPANPQP
jgi:Domain of unknown function (DUF4157)